MAVLNLTKNLMTENVKVFLVTSSFTFFCQGLQ